MLYYNDGAYTSFRREHQSSFALGRTIQELTVAVTLGKYYWMEFVFFRKIFSTQERNLKEYAIFAGWDKIITDDVSTSGKNRGVK